MQEDRIYNLIFSNNKKVKFFLFFAIIAFICTLPYMGENTYIICKDMMFHIQRVNEIAEGIKHGEWLPSLQEGNMKGMGYLVDVFYPSAFLYIPALLVVAKINPLVSMVIFIYLIYLSTINIAFFSSKIVTQSTKFSFYFATVYTIFPIRVTNDTTRGLLGQIIGSAFLPIVILGTYHLLKNNKWKMLAMGMILLTYSHLISLFLSAIFIALYLFVFNFKESINKKTITNLIKATITTIIVGSGFLIPFIINISNDNFKMDIDKKELGIRAFDVTFGLFEIHWSVAIVFQVFLIIGLSKLKKIIERREDKDFSLLSISTIYSLIMLTNLFPWELCEYIPGINNIQFSFRIINIISVIVSILITKIILSIKNMDMIFLVSFINTILILTIMPPNKDELDIKKTIYWNNENKTYFSVVSGEYVPTDLYLSLPDEWINQNIDNSIVLIDGEETPAKKSWHSLTLETNEKHELIETNLTYYKGYNAYLNNHLIPIQSKNGKVCLNNVEAGTINIVYEVDNVQKITAIISITCAIMFALLNLKDIRRLKHE